MRNFLSTYFFWPGERKVFKIQKKIKSTQREMKAWKGAVQGSSEQPLPAGSCCRVPLPALPMPWWVPLPPFISQCTQPIPAKMNSSHSPDIKQALQQAPKSGGPVLCLIPCQVLVCLQLLATTTLQRAGAASTPPPPPLPFK